MKTPEGLGRRGRALWRELAAVLDLDHHERALLTEAARVADRLDLLDAAVRQAGVLLPDGRGPNPALVEARQQQLVLARLLAALRLPDDINAPEGDRPQRRQARGVYVHRAGRP